MVESLFNKHQGDEDCGFLKNHSEIYETIKRETPPEEVLYDLAELFKVFGDSTRIKILFLLFESELCVCAIAELLGASQSAVSHQLKVLKTNKLVKSRRDGKTIYYSLADSHVHDIIARGLEHIEE